MSEIGPLPAPGHVEFVDGHDARLPATQVAEAAVDCAIEFNRRFIAHGENLALVFRDYLLGRLLAMTASEFGFIAEVAREAEGAWALRVFGHALTDISWNEETRRLYRDHMDTMAFRKPETLYGAVINTKRPVISNSVDDRRRGGIPDGHPPILSFMGLPLVFDGEIQGVIGLANRPGGYEAELPAALSPVLEACSTAMTVAQARASRDAMLINLATSQRVLSDQNAALQETLRMKDIFVASVSHEFRTPLTAIRSFSDLLEEDVSEPQREMCRAIQRNAKRLGALVEDVLLLTANGKVPVSLEPADASQLILTNVADSQEALSAASLTLHVDGLDREHRVVVDAPRFLQAVCNVLTNAVKFSPPGATVEMGLADVEDGCAITITDHGTGMSPRDLEMARQPFHRGVNASRNGVGGTGLGLFIVDQIMLAHGGRMEMSSEEGCGTTVTLVFPKAS